MTDKDRTEYQKAYIKAYCEEHREEAKARSKAWREAHRKEIKAYSKKYYATHGEEIKAYLKARQQECKAYAKTYSRLYRKKHKAKYAMYTASRKIAKLQRTLGEYSEEIKAFYLESERLTRETGIKYSVDHIIPLRGKLVSGFHVPWNLQVIPLNENRSKGNRIEMQRNC